MIEQFGPSLYLADGPAVSFFGFPYPTRMALALAPLDASVAELYMKSLYEPSGLTLVELRQLTALIGGRLTILIRIATGFRARRRPGFGERCAGSG